MSERDLIEALEQIKAYRPEPGEETRPGHVIWHSSEEDGGPDVGLSLGLGDDLMLWVGEVSNLTLEENGIDPSKGDGWWIAIYKDKGVNIIGSVVCETHIAQELVEHLSSVLLASRSPAGGGEETLAQAGKTIMQLDATNNRLSDAIIEAIDLLAERTHGSHARSPGHNARLCLEAALQPGKEER